MKSFVRRLALWLALAVLLCGLKIPALADGDSCPHAQTTIQVETVTEATCTEAGSQINVMVCTVCGEELSRETVAVSALGHDYGELVEFSAATCTEGGTYGRICARCGGRVTEEWTPPLDHEYEDGVCIHCGQVLNGVITWAELQASLRLGGEITLLCDITASPEDAALTVPSRTEAILHLNGKTLDRHLTSPEKKGSVIIVQGSLTITGTGVITGGNTSGTGGGVWVTSGGGLTLAGGAISGNEARYVGGGVYVSGIGSYFNMESGTITGNAATNGGGAGIDNSGSIDISGGVISGNMASGNGGGLWFGGSQTVLSVSGGSITGNAAEGMGGGLYINGSGSFDVTDGVISGNTASAGRDIASKDGEYAVKYSVTIWDGVEGGAVTANKAAAAEGETVTLTPEAENGYYRFNSFTVTSGETIIPTQPADGGTYTFVMPADNVLVTAVFDPLYEISTYVSLYNDHYGTNHGCTLIADSAKAAAGDTVTLTMHMEPGYTLMSAQSGSVIEINGDFSLVQRVDSTTFTFVMPEEDVDAWAYIETAEYMITLNSSLSGVEFRVGDEYVWDPAPQPAFYNELIQVRYLRTDENELQTMTYTYTEMGVTSTVDIPFRFENSDGFYYGSFRMPNGSVSVRLTYTELHTISEDWENLDNGLVAASLPRAAAGDEIHLWAIPDDTYELVEWRVTGADGTPVAVSPLVGEDNGCRFTMPDTDVTFYAVFEKAFYEIIAGPFLEHGTIDIAGGAFARPGDTVLCTVTPDEHYEFLSVYAEGNDEYYSIQMESDNEFSFVMPENDVTLVVTFGLEDGWSTLREALQQGGTIVLYHEYIAESSDAPLSVPAGVSATLDLNGHRINGNDLTSNEVISVHGSLTVDDNGRSGSIEGEEGTTVIDVYGSLLLNEGWIMASGCDCGGVFINPSASFTMNDGWVYSYDSIYGTVYGDLNSEFTMNGGTVNGYDSQQVVATGGFLIVNDGEISGTCDDIVYVENGGMTMNGGIIDGTPASSGHGVHINGGYLNILYSPDISHDVYLAGGSQIFLDHATVGEDVVFRVRSSRLGNFAAAWFGMLTESDLAHFESADPTCGIRLNSGKAELYKLPGNMTAVYDWAQLYSALLNGGNIILAQDISAASSDNFLGVPSGVTVSLDLNGHTIDGSDLDTRFVLVIDGTMTLSDSGTDGAIFSNYMGTGIVKVQKGSLTMQGGTIYSYWCSKIVYVQGNFTMNGGRIYDAGCEEVVSVGKGGRATMNGGSIESSGSVYGGLIIFNGGSFTMNGGEITGEGSYRVVYAAGDLTVTGGEIISYYHNAIQIIVDQGTGAHGSVTLTGGKVAAPAAGKYAVIVPGGSEFRLAGSPVITPTDRATVLLKDNAVIRVTGALGENVKICALKAELGVIASGAGFSLSDADLAHFASADPAYDVRLNANHEVELFARERYTVSFSAGGGSGEMEDQTAYEGVAFVLPACGFIPPEDMIFSAWSVSVGGAQPAEYAPGDELFADANTVVTAVWESDLHDQLILPASLGIIDEEAFFGDTSLDEVVLPASLERINAKAFAGSAVRRINLPASLVYIADDAFADCSLQRVIAEGEYALQWCANHGITPVPAN